MNFEMIRIKEASDGLLYLSESDFPFELVEINEDGNLESRLLKLSNKREDTPIEKVSLDYFFRNMVKAFPESDEKQKKIASRYIHLQDVLKEQLIEINVYRIGEIQIDAYIIGKMKNGTYGGLSTKLIET